MTVVDVSVLAGMVFPDETPTMAEQEQVRVGLLVLPILARFEFANIMVMNERRGRIDADGVARALTWFETIIHEFDDRADLADVIALARRHRLTAYDAAYLELALRRRVPLLTRDAALVAAALAEGVGAAG